MHKFCCVLIAPALLLLCTWSLLVCVLPVTAGAAGQAEDIIGPGDLLPPHTFGGELSKPDSDYLGLSPGFLSLFKKKSFAVQDIPADILVVEFFNNYCTSCQAQAPVMNAVFNRIAASDTLSSKVRFLGVGAGNNQREVDRFKLEKNVLFPLFPDASFAYYNAIGDPGGTPFVIIAKKTDAGFRIVATHMGLEKDPEYFFQKVHEAALQDSQPQKASAVDMLRSGPDRVLALPFSEGELEAAVRASMQAACAGRGTVTSVTRISLPGREGLFRGELSGAKDCTLLFSHVASRKPVCDVCHGVHFIVTFNSEGTILDFTPLHVTKYGNVLWDEKDVDRMRQNLLGRSLEAGLVFHPETDAVSQATMSSSIIYNSVNNLKAVYKQLKNRAQ